MSSTAPRGALRIVTPDELAAREREADLARVAAEDAAKKLKTWTTDLGAYVDNEFQIYRNHRDSASGWTERLNVAMRMFKGEYDASKLADIKRFGGSEVYAPIVATKARSASSLLRDVYLGAEKPWSLVPTPDPTLPEDVAEQIKMLVQSELAFMASRGQPVDASQVRDRVMGLFAAAKNAAVKKARDEAKTAQARLDDILVEGKFYEALADFLVDLPLFPFACIKGPVVRIVPAVTWKNGKAVVEEKPRMFWYRVSPYDLWWTPGVSNIADASVIERQRLTRVDLNQLIGLPGYNEDAIRGVLRDYGRSGYLLDSSDSSQTQRAEAESRENPQFNQSGIIEMLEFHGYIPGQLLLDYGLTLAEIPDPDRDYFVDVFKIGRYVIKVQISASVRKRPPYYATSFEKVPGTIVGKALPDTLQHLQDSANAMLRSLINNAAIASGPQVVIDDKRFQPQSDTDDLYPWKRWHTDDDPLSNGARPPIEFFQPNMHVQELMGAYKELTNIADDLSALPKYVTGSDRLGGAGRTASGLAMLMGNASKVMQTVAANVDIDVVDPVIAELYDMVMLTDTTGMLRGDESIDVQGVNIAVQRETARQRQLEFLQATANPFDMQIMGLEGRAKVLRSVSTGLGLPGEDIVPPEDVLKQMPAIPPPGAQPGGPGGGVAAGGDPTAQPPAVPQGGQPTPAVPQTNVVQ